VRPARFGDAGVPDPDMWPRRNQRSGPVALLEPSLGDAERGPGSGSGSGSGRNSLRRSSVQNTTAIVASFLGNQYT
jgi:hypothetical protein